MVVSTFCGNAMLLARDSDLMLCCFRGASTIIDMLVLAKLPPLGILPIVCVVLNSVSLLSQSTCSESVAPTAPGINGGRASGKRDKQVEVVGTDNSNIVYSNCWKSGIDSIQTETEKYRE